MPESLHLSKPTLAYAKLVATPTATSWSQVYNAGNLFACVSLTVEGEPDESLSLASAGKAILDNLQTEFFLLEEKSLPTITEVITKSLQNVPESVTPAVTVGFFKDSVLYIFVVGQGRVIMKRQGQIGVLLESKTSQETVHTASGYLQNEDTVVLETKPFAQDLQDQALTSALELSIPNDIAEALSPQLHAREDGGQAAIIVVYHGASKQFAASVPQDSEDETLGSAVQAEEAHAPAPTHEAEEEELEDEEDVDEKEFEEEEGDEEQDDEHESSRKKIHVGMPKMPQIGFLKGITSKVHAPAGGGFNLTHSRKLFLSISVVLIILIAVSIYFTKTKAAEEQKRALFEQVYEPALSKYESARDLETVNEETSMEEYEEAKRLLTDNINKFPKDSSEAKQMQDLLAKINAELSVSGSVESANATEAKVGENSLLAVAKANKDAKGLTQDDTSVYYVTDKAVFSVSKGSGEKKELIKNNNAWSDAVGISTYLGNFYVLDRSKGIIKFAAGGFAQSPYFKDKPDMSAARDLAIDSSVYVLMKDGNISKFTSGVAEGYKIPKLAKAMSDPVKIFTDANTTNVYILDKGNSRVVRLAKEGSEHTEFTSGVIKSARDFEVREKDKKILILSGDKVYEISM